MSQYQRMSSLDELLMLLDHQMVRDQIRTISNSTYHPGIDTSDDGDEAALSTLAAPCSLDYIDDTNITDDFVHVVLLPVKKETFVQKQRRTGRVDGGLQDTQRQTSVDELVDLIDHNMVRTEDITQKTDHINPNHPQYERLSSLNELLSLLDHNMVRDQIRKISNTITPNEGVVPDVIRTDEEIIGRMVPIAEKELHESENSTAGDDDEKVISHEVIIKTHTPSSENNDKNEDMHNKRVTFDPHTKEYGLDINSAGGNREGVRRKVTPGISKDASSSISVNSKHSPHKGFTFLNDFLSLLKSNILVRERIRKISEQNVAKFPLSDEILKEGSVDILKLDPIQDRNSKTKMFEAKESSTNLINAEREHTKL